MILPPELAEAVDQLREVRANKRAIERTEKVLRDRLLQYLEGAGETEGLLASGAVGVSINRYERTSINRARLEALYPEIFEECLTSATVTVLNLPD
jgi:hypothetical protein